MNAVPPDGAEFDTIIVGAGTAGCLLANRLSADPRRRVLLVEAGGKDNWIWLHIPAGYLFAIGNPRADWLLRTEPEPGLNGRQLNYPRGKVLGGSSAINGMIYMRGQAADYDGWRQLGLTGWGWDDVLPYFLKHQDHAAPPGPLHRGGGEWRIEHPRIRWDILDAFQEAAAQAGIPKVADFNGGDNEGSSYFQVNQRRGRRWSAARGFLDPIRNRPNLTILTGARVKRLVIEGKRVTGIVHERGGGEVTARARAGVVLSAGAIASPHLMQVSGIGPGAVLSANGIPVVHDLPGVGENLQDHLQLRPVFKVSGVRTLNTDYAKLWKRAWMGVEYALMRRGPLTMAPSQLGMFTRSSPDYATPNVQFHVQPLSLDRFGEPLHPFAAFTASVCNLRPSSIGHVRLKGPDPFAAPAIRPNYLATEEDRRVAADSIRLVRRIVAQPALALFQPREHTPGEAITDEEGLVKAAGDIGTTIFHPVGTAKMGIDSDPMAVVDGRLAVRGLEGLRVIDASVMPRITSGNTNSPVLMIAEKGAEAILTEERG